MDCRHKRLYSISHVSSIAFSDTTVIGIVSISQSATGTTQSFVWGFRPSSSVTICFYFVVLVMQSNHRIVSREPSMVLLVVLKIVGWKLVDWSFELPITLVLPHYPHLEAFEPQSTQASFYCWTPYPWHSSQIQPSMLGTVLNLLSPHTSGRCRQYSCKDLIYSELPLLCPTLLEDLVVRFETWWICCRCCRCRWLGFLSCCCVTDWLHVSWFLKRRTTPRCHRMTARPCSMTSNRALIC